MGYAIADAFAARGAKVILVSGPVGVQTTDPGVEVIRVTTAQEMYNACVEIAANTDIAVFNAAVSDFTPEEPSHRKVKRGNEPWTIRLKPTKGQLFVGFALETDHGVEHARNKLKTKNLDLIVLNSLEEQGAGFGTNTNRVTMIDRSGKMEPYELKPKHQVAADLVERVIKMTEDA